MSEKKVLDSLSNSLPYNDGTGKRRFIAGGIVLASIAIYFWQDFLSFQDQIDKLVKSPTFFLGLILLIYAIGNISDLIGDLFLIKAASGISEIKKFFKRNRPKNEFLRVIMYPILFYASFILIPIFMYMYMTGSKKYELNLDHLSKHAKSTLNKLPIKVVDGIKKPLNENSDLATIHLLGMFSKDLDIKWARSRINRSKDISSVTSAVVISLLIGLVLSVLEKQPIGQFQSGFQKPSSLIYKETIDSVKTIGFSEKLINKIDNRAQELTQMNYVTTSEYIDNIVTIKNIIYQELSNHATDFEKGLDRDLVKKLIQQINVTEYYLEQLESQYPKNSQSALITGILLQINLYALLLFGLIALYVGFFNNQKIYLSGIIERLAINRHDSSD